jgi:GT2 family glycosyltransferase
MGKTVSIIVVNWNNREYLKRALDSISAQSPLDYGIETIVVDNASTDGSPQFIRDRCPDVYLIQNKKNVGFGRANNQAIGVSTGDYLLLLNSDAFLPLNSLSKMLSVMEEFPEVGVLGPQLVYPDGRLQLSHGPLPILWTEIVSLSGLDKRIPLKNNFQSAGGYIPTGWVSGACFLIRRSTLNQIGLLDDDFFFFSEEVDFCFRAIEAGWLVGHYPDVRVVHLEAGSSGITAYRTLHLYRAKLKYFRKHHNHISVILFKLAIWLATLSKALCYSILGGIYHKYYMRSKLWRETLVGLPSIYP